MQPTSIYVVLLTRDGDTILQPRCFVHELAARADAECLAEGKLDWLTPRYGMDERQTEFEVRQLTTWRFGADRQECSS